jgi:cell division protein FtsB
MSGQRDGKARRTSRRRSPTQNPPGRAVDGEDRHPSLPSKPSRATAPPAPSTPAPKAVTSPKPAGRSATRGTARAGAGRSRGLSPSRPTAGRSMSSRPALASRGRTAAPPEERESSAWVRGAILATILVVLAVTLAPTARSLLRQRGEIAALQEKVVQQQQSVADLQREQARWADPAYVEQQARERLKFVKVGDRSYSVIDPASEAPKPPTTAIVAAPQADANAPWYGQVWQSIRLADQPSAGMAPVPDQ